MSHSKPEQSKQVRPANPLIKLIGVNLERVHCVSSKALNIYAGEKSVTLCFGNGKSIHFDAELCSDRDGVYPVIRLREGEWEMIKPTPDNVCPISGELDCSTCRVVGDCDSPHRRISKDLNYYYEPDIEIPEVEVGAAGFHTLDGADQD